MTCCCFSFLHLRLVVSQGSYQAYEAREWVKICSEERKELSGVLGAANCFHQRFETYWFLMGVPESLDVGVPGIPFFIYVPNCAVHRIGSVACDLSVLAGKRVDLLADWDPECLVD